MKNRTNKQAISLTNVYKKKSCFSTENVRKNIRENIRKMYGKITRNLARKNEKMKINAAGIKPAA